MKWAYVCQEPSDRTIRRLMCLARFSGLVCMTGTLRGRGERRTLFGSGKEWRWDRSGLVRDVVRRERGDGDRKAVVVVAKVK